MLIACPSCSTTYQIELAALGPAGRSVRCSHCRNTWFATQGDVLAVTAAAMAEDAPVESEPEPEPAPSPPPAEADGAWTVAESAPDDATPAPDIIVPTLVEAPPTAPDEPAPLAEPPTVDAGVPDSIESIAAERARRIEARRRDRPSLARRLASAPMLILTLAAILGASLYWRVTMVRYLPQTASLFAAIGLPVNLRGLVFDNVKSLTEMQDGVAVLVIEGTIANVTREALEVPRLRFALRNAAGQEIYAWTALPAKAKLGAGDGFAFRSRLASPPADGRDVVVRFFNRRDATASLQ